MVDMPYFMENEDWYYFDFKKRKYMLTAEAPDKAKESYEQFYKEVEAINNAP